MGHCIAYSELIKALEGNLIRQREAHPENRLEWLLARHNTDGSDGCDWCVLAEAIRRLRAIR